MVPKERMQDDLNSFARSVAIALKSESIRALVRTSMISSPFRENKLHLATFLRTEGAELLKAVATASERSSIDVYTTLDAHC
jgi:hypothetical protein